jgi:photosystem II stability/assembly factor-like uncharacterized protein
VGIRVAASGRWRQLKVVPLRRRPFGLRVLWICAAILAACSVPSARANHVHMHGGPFIGVVLAVGVDPSAPKTLYVVAHGGGVFRSKDGGESWLAVNAGLPNRQVFSLLLHPRQAGNLYLGTDQGVFRSTDEGLTWRSFSHFLDKRNIRALAADPEDPDLLYTATDKGVFSGRKGRWRRLSLGLKNDDVRAVAVDPKGTVFSGTFGGVYKKERSQSRWREVGEGLSNKRIRALAMEPASPGVLYAGTATSGVFKTTNGGKSWQEFNRGLLNSTILSLLRVPLPEQSLYAGTVDGIFESKAGKNQWSSIGPELPFTVSAIAFDPTLPLRLYAGSGGRVYKSNDAGKKWQEVSHRINYSISSNQLLRHCLSFHGAMRESKSFQQEGR